MARIVFDADPPSDSVRGHAGYVFSDSALPVAVDQIHAASGQHEPLEDFVGFQVDQNIRQGIAHSDNAFHFFR